MVTGDNEWEEHFGQVTRVVSDEVEGLWTSCLAMVTTSRHAFAEESHKALIQTTLPTNWQEEIYDQRLTGQVTTVVKGGVVETPCNGHDITSRTLLQTTLTTSDCTLYNVQGLQKVGVVEF